MMSFSYREAAPMETRFDRALGPMEAGALVVGTVVGPGIFVAPALVAQQVGGHGTGAILLVWALCGLLSLFGAMAYGELAGMFPRAGGQYVFLREAFGPLPAFLFGWMEFWLARAGSMAVAAVLFAYYAGHFTHLDGEWGVRWTAFLVVFGLTLVNCLSIRSGGTVQVLCTALKVAALAALAVCAFGMEGGRTEHLLPAWSSGEGGLLAALGGGAVAALWAFNGWANGAAVSEEMREPRRDVPRALVGGVALVTVLYLALNLAVHYLLPVAEVGTSKDVITGGAEILFGPVGAGLVAAAAMIAAFGSVNGLLLTGPRVFHAMARDGLFFPDLADLHPRFRTPYLAVLFQGLWAGFLILIPYNDLFAAAFGWRPAAPLYEQLFTLVMFASWAFYGLTVFGMMRLRRRQPEAERPYRAWGYPVAPALFLLGSGLFTLNLLATHPAESLAGVCVVLLGLPAFWWWSRRPEVIQPFAADAVAVEAS